MYSNFCKKLAGILSILTGALLIGVLALSMLNIILRNVLSISWLMGDVLLKLMFVWLIFLGSSVVLYQCDHLKMDFFSRKFSPRMTRIVAYAGTILTMGLLAILIFYGLKVTSIRMSIPFESYKLIPTGYLFLSLPVCAVMMMVFCVDHLLKLKKFGTIKEPSLIEKEVLEREKEETDEGIRALKNMEGR